MIRVAGTMVSKVDPYPTLCNFIINKGDGHTLKKTHYSISLVRKDKIVHY